MAADFAWEGTLWSVKEEIGAATTPSHRAVSAAKGKGSGGSDRTASQMADVIVDIRYWGLVLGSKIKFCSLTGDVILYERI